MDKEQKRSNILAQIGIAIFAALLLGAAGASLFREYGKDYFISKTTAHVPDKKAAADWLAAIEANDMKRALLAAKRIVPDYQISLPRREYMLLLRVNDMNSTILTDDFNRLDYDRWKDALALKKLSKSLIKSKDTTLHDLYQAVIGKVKYSPAAPKTYPPYSAMEIWERGYGTNEDRIRLFCNLAQQAGCETKIISLLKKTGRPILALCEADNNGRIDAIDFSHNKFFKGLSVEELSQKPELIPQDWTPLQRKALKRGKVYIYPAEFQDYRAQNQKLASRLEKINMPGIPTLDSGPSENLARYIKNRGINKSSNHFGYWHIPIAAVRSMPKPSEKWLKKHKPAEY